MNRRRFALAGLLSLAVSPIGAQSLNDISFRNQPIPDILQVLGEAGGCTVSIDETVGGTASFRSPGMDVREALELFLSQNRLFGRWEGNVLRVSRYDIRMTAPDALTLMAEDVPVDLLVAALARETGRPVVHDALPGESITLYASEQSLESLLEVIVSGLSEFQLDRNEGYFRISRRIRDGSRSGTRRVGDSYVSSSDDGYAVSFEQARFQDVLADLFEAGGREYSYLGRSDSLLSRMEFRPRTFDEALRLILDQSRTDYTVVGDIYYIFDIQGADVLARYKRVVRRPLTHIPVKAVPSFFPPGFLTPGTLTADEKNNVAILYGSLEDLSKVQAFLDSIDRPARGKSWVRCDLDYLETGSLPDLLPRELAMVELKSIPGTDSVLAWVSEDQAERLSGFLAIADEPAPGTPVTLRYIRADDLIEHLPPAFDKDDIIKTQRDSLVFFRGSREKLNDFRAVLAAMDRPVPQIRYDVLVVQYQESRSWNWESSLSGAPSSTGDSTAFLGSLSPLFGMNFDIVSSFGYRFAVGLSNELTESRAKVIADTTLNGLSGESISFRSTTTSRFREYQEDEETGEIETKGDIEITSGLFLDIEGWVSGDDMVTMDISATISKQGSGSDSELTLPPTTEKILNTNIRSQGGKPVIIGGLTQQEESRSVEKIPFLGDIPLLGLLFRRQSSTVEDAELVVYIVPHIEFDRDDATDAGGLFERTYEKFIAR